MSERTKPVHVIGLCSTGHGAGAALVSSEYGVRASTLERFTGVKHSILFTQQELTDILSRSSPIDKGIYDALTFSYGEFPPAFTIERTLVPFLEHLLRGLPIGPDDIDLVITADSYFAFNVGRIGRTLNCLFKNAEFHTTLEHHEIHQWQAYLPSGFSEAAVITVDESGEPLSRLDGQRISMTLSHARDLSIDVLHEHLHPTSSPGLLYAVFSRHLGFRAGEEGKTMGLAPYGRDSVYQELRPQLKLHDDGSFAFMDEPQLVGRLSEHVPKRQRSDRLEPVHADVAFAGQQLMEDVLVHAARVLETKLPGVKSLCIAGGVGLNSCANERVMQRTSFSDVYITPNPGDNGQALACALYGAQVLKGIPRRAVTQDYLGPPIAADEIERTLSRRALTATKVSAFDVAKLLADGRIIALFQGPSEHGPRALGNRSILADPRQATMADSVNANVKRREMYRPYAPIVLEDKANDWFECTVPSPFMLRVVRVRSECRQQLGAITHVDGTARVQTLNAQSNPWLCDIITAFESITGVPVLMNTSFNLAGKPIVESVDDAVECYLETGLDGLLLDRYLLLKKDPPSMQSRPEAPDFDEYQQLLRAAPTRT